MFLHIFFSTRSSWIRDLFKIAFLPISFSKNANVVLTYYDFLAKVSLLHTFRCHCVKSVKNKVWNCPPVFMRLKPNAHGMQNEVDEIWTICAFAMMEMVRSGHSSLCRFRRGLHPFYYFAVKYFLVRSGGVHVWVQPCWHCHYWHLIFLFCLLLSIISNHLLFHAWSLSSRRCRDRCDRRNDNTDAASGTDDEPFPYRRNGIKR